MPGPFGTIAIPEPVRTVSRGSWLARGGRLGPDHVLGDAVGPADPDRFHVTGLHEAVDGLLRHPHDRRHLEDGQEPGAGQGRGVVSHGASVSDIELPLARQMVLQVAVRDIRQLTYIERPAATNRARESRRAAGMSAARGTVGGCWRPFILPCGPGSNSGSPTGPPS